MADVQPFVALLYNSSSIQIADVITEPYDKITPAMQKAYLARHPNNIVRIILGPDQPGDNETSNKYTRATQWFQDWKKHGILVSAPARAMYAYEQTFELPKGTKRIRRAIIASVRLTGYGEGEILPHEQTLTKPKEDRFKLLRATHAHFGQIFLLYKDGLETAAFQAKAEAVFDFHDENGIGHRLSAISDGGRLKQLQDYFAAKTFYIADGHHRYETALAFRDQQREAFPDAGPEAAHEFIMATLVDMDDPGLFILPTHRLILNVAGFEERNFLAQLEDWFSLAAEQTLDSLLANLDRVVPGEHWFGLTLPGERHWLLKLRTEKDRSAFFKTQPPLWENLDVSILQVLVLERLLNIDDTRLRQEENVRYYREAELAARQVLNGKGQMALYLSPTRVGEVKAVADARSRMPQKSTDFYPKLPTGLVVYPI